MTTLALRAINSVYRLPMTIAWAFIRTNPGKFADNGFAPALPWYDLGILLDIQRDFAMSETSQKRALKNYRKRLNRRGMARFEVLGLDADRELIRSLARRLAENRPDSARIRATVRRAISGEPPNKGGILNALRRSPLVGADLNLKRPVTGGRKVDL